MSDNGEAQIQSAASDRELVVTRSLDAPRTLVWKAWTTPEHLAVWWRPVDFDVLDCEIDLKVGGAFRVTLRGPDGALYPGNGGFREVVPPERIVYEGLADDPDSQAHNPGGAGMPPGARVTVTFEERDGKTEVTVMTRFPSVAAQRAAVESGYDTGWTDGLAQLGALLRRLQAP